MLENELATLLIGEFAGKVYKYSKLIAAIDSLLKKKNIDESLAEFYKNLKKFDGKDFLVYFNTETKSLFGLQMNYEHFYPYLCVYKPTSLNWEEIREVCNKAYELVPGLTIQVTDESSFNNLKHKIVA